MVLAKYGQWACLALKFMAIICITPLVTLIPVKGWTTGDTLYCTTHGTAGTSKRHVRTSSPKRADLAMSEEESDTKTLDRDACLTHRQLTADFLDMTAQREHSTLVRLFWRPSV